MADRRDADSSIKEPLLSPEHHDLESDGASNEGTGMGQRRKRASNLERRFTLNRSSKRSSGLRERSLPAVEQSVPEDEEENDVAFTIIVNRNEDNEGDDTGQADSGKEDEGRLEVDFVQEAVAEAVQEALQDTVQEVVQDAVQEAVAQAFEDNVRFDVRANAATLFAIFGVVLFWRGCWTGDYFFGLTIWSALGSGVAGLCIMMAMRLLRVPLVESLPGG